MASNNVLPGTIIRTFTAPGGGVVSGTPVWDATALILYVPLSSEAAGSLYAAAQDGVWTLAATAADDWAVGEPLFWDPATSKLTDQAGALTRVGTAYAAKAALATSAQVDLSVVHP